MHHYSLDYDEAFSQLTNENASLLEKPKDNDHSNFTFLGSWSNHYTSWKNSKDFKY